MNSLIIYRWIQPLVGAVILLAFALIVWHPFKRPLKPTGLILLSGAIWLFTHALELSTSDLDLKIILLKLKYVGIVMLPVSWYLTGITYIYLKHKERILPRLLIIFAPLVTLGLAFTNEYHGLFWTEIYLQKEDPFLELSTDKGWGYWVFLVFAFSLVIASMAPYLKTLKRYMKAFRIQTVFLMLGASLPIVGTLFDLLDLGFLPSLELTPLASGLSVLLIFTLNQRLRIGGIVPMRRDTIIDHMAEIIIVLDARDNVLDLNSQASTFLQLSRAKATGRNIAQITPPQYHMNWSEIIQISSTTKIVTIPNPDGIILSYEISCTPIQLELSDIRGVIVALHDITELQKIKGAIEASLTEKEILFQEIHHRIRNNLQVVSSLLLLQMMEVDDSELRNIFNESRNRIQAMALVHDKLYQTSDLSSIPLDAYIQELSHLLVDSQPVGSKRIELRFDIEPISVKIDTTITCGLILNELISNAIKHAFPTHQGGLIEVEIRKLASGHLRLSVYDNGIGLPMGVDLRNGASLGLQLISTLVAQLKGSIEVTQSPGTKFLIEFPV